MKSLEFLLALLCLAALATPAAAQMQSRAYAPEDLRELSHDDQARVIGLEYQEQSGGRRIPDDQLRFYLDQVNRSHWTFSRIRGDIARSLAGNGWEPGPAPWPGGTVERLRCESVGTRTRTCDTPWPGRSRLVRQLSDSACVEGRSWNARDGQVTVWGGCRAEFAPDWQAGPGPGIPPQAIRCESSNNRTRTCRTPWSGPSQLVRQLSDTACIPGRSWNSRSGEVTVWGGCRGEFAPAWSSPNPGPGMEHGQAIRCESTNNRTRTCPTPWRGSSRLLRQLSESRCIEGRSWNSHGGQVTVWGGCRGEFGPGRGSTWDAPPRGGNGGRGYSVTCVSDRGRYTTCHWAPGQGQPRLLRQLSREPCIAGRSWGMVDHNTLWVDHGCRARFGN